MRFIHMTMIYLLIFLAVGLAVGGFGLYVLWRFRDEIFG